MAECEAGAAKKPGVRGSAAMKERTGESAVAAIKRQRRELADGCDEEA